MGWRWVAAQLTSGRGHEGERYNAESWLMIGSGEGAACDEVMIGMRQVMLY